MKGRYFTCKQKKIKFKCYSFCVTLHNGSCAKLEWKCENGTAKCKSNGTTVADTVCTNAELTKPTCPTPKTYYITPSITPVLEGTHLEIHLSVVDAQATSANLPDDENFVMYFRYQYKEGGRTITATIEQSGKGVGGLFTVGGNASSEQTNPKILDAGFNSSFTKQIEYGNDTYIMNEPSITKSPECGSAHGKLHSFTPENPHLCAIGNASSVAQPTLANGWKYNWTCSIDGQTQNCSASATKTATFSITSVGGASTYQTEPRFTVRWTSTPTIQDKHFFDGVTLGVMVEGKCVRYDSTDHVFENEEVAGPIFIDYQYCDIGDFNTYYNCEQNVFSGRWSYAGGLETTFVDGGGMFAKSVCGWEDPLDINKVFLLKKVEITSVNGNTKRTDWEFNR